MIKVTVSNILNSEQALTNLSMQKLPASMAFQVVRLIKAIREEMDGINKSRMALTEKYGERQADGTLIIDENSHLASIDKSLVNDFIKESNEFLATEISIGADPIPLSTLDGIDITPQEAEQLFPFISM